MKDFTQKERGKCFHEECSSFETECPEFIAEEGKFNCAFCGHLARSHHLKLKDLSSASFSILESQSSENISSLDISGSSHVYDASNISGVVPSKKRRHEDEAGSLTSETRSDDVPVSVSLDSSLIAEKSIPMVRLPISSLKVRTDLLCYSCEFTCSNIRILSAHTRRMHNTFLQKLGLRCSKCFEKFTFHALYMKHHCPRGEINKADASEGEVMVDVYEGELSENVMENIDSFIANVPSEDALKLEKDLITILCLELEGLHNIPHVGLNKVIYAMKDLRSMHEEMSFECEKFYKGISTDKRRKTYYQSLEIYVAPEKILLNNGEVGFIINLSKLLTTLGNNEVYFNYFKNNFEDSTSEIFYDTTQSLGFLNHPGKKLHSTNNIAITMYSDDVGFESPLGMHRNKSNLTLFYISFLNVPVELRSKSHHMHFIGSVNSKVFKNPENQKLFLESFISQINLLQTNGIMINGEKFYAYLFGYTGDALAVHQVLGFKMSFGPNIKRPCRSCNILYKDISNVSSHDACQLRCMDEHSRRVNILESLLVEDNLTRHKVFSMEHGINRMSPLCDVENFSIFDHVFYDALHILFEGLVPKEASAILKTLSNDKLLNRDMLNKEISEFKFHHTIISTKYPCPFGIEFKIVSTSAAMHNLIVHLPIFLKGISSNNKHKICLFMLLDICKIIWAPNTTDDTILELRNLVEAHHQLLLELYGNAFFVPKHHMLVHLVNQLQQFGPGRWLSTIRGEAKHFIAKRKRYFNFKNLALSVANVFQVNQAFSLFGRNMILLDQEVCSSTNKYISEDSILQELSPDCQFQQLKSLKVHGISYIKGDIVVTGENNYYAVFGIIYDIFLNNDSEAMLLCNMTHSFYNKVLCAYEVIKLPTYKLVKVKELHHPKPMPLYHIDGKLIAIVTDGRQIGHLR